jgi:uncharacterized membrane protein
MKPINAGDELRKQAKWSARVAWEGAILGMGFITLAAKGWYVWPCVVMAVLSFGMTYIFGFGAKYDRARADICDENEKQIIQRRREWLNREQGKGP